MEKLKLHFVAAIASFIGIALVLAEDDPFSNPTTQSIEPRPLRDIEDLPKAITYRHNDDGTHIYVVSGIYAHSSDRDRPSDRSDVLGYVPECIDAIFDFESRRLEMTTSRRLTLSELAYAIDDLAFSGGDVPYWDELEARDIKKSSLFSNKAYELASYSGEVPMHLAWLSIPKWKPLTTAFSYDLVEQGKLLITPTTAHCMAHSRFSVRVLDAEGRVIWQDLNTLVADLRIALTDIDRDGSHDVIIDQNDHGKSTRFLLRRIIEQGDDAN